MNDASESTFSYQLIASLKSQKCTWSPEWYDTDPNLDPPERVVMRYIVSLSVGRGYCDCSDQYIADKIGYKNVNGVKNLQTSLGKKFYIYRKTYENGHRVIIPLKLFPGHSNDDLEILVKNLPGHLPDDLRVIYQMIVSPHPSYNVKEQAINKLKHSENWSKPIKPQLLVTPSSSDLDRVSSGEEASHTSKARVAALPPKVRRTPPPTPGSSEMVAEVRELLSKPFKIGRSSIQIHEDSLPYFYGYSPIVLTNAVAVVNADSWDGKKIANIPLYILHKCAKLRRER